MVVYDLQCTAEIVNLVYQWLRKSEHLESMPMGLARTFKLTERFRQTDSMTPHASSSLIHRKISLRRINNLSRLILASTPHEVELMTKISSFSPAMLKAVIVRCDVFGKRNKRRDLWQPHLPPCFDLGQVNLQEQHALLLLQRGFDLAELQIPRMSRIISRLLL